MIVNEFGESALMAKFSRAAATPPARKKISSNLPTVAYAVRSPTSSYRRSMLFSPSGGVEHIVIETSGLALPKPLVQAFHWPAIKNRVTVDGVVVVVDGAALADGRVAHDLKALASNSALPTPRSRMMIQSKKSSRTSSHAPIWSCSTSAI